MPSVSQMPKNLGVLRNPSSRELRELRQILSDVAYVTLAAAGAVPVPSVELGDAISRILLWRSRVTANLAERLVNHPVDVTTSLSPTTQGNEGEDQ